MLKIDIDSSNVSDGYHTFSELYEHRNILYLSFLKLLTETNSALAWRSRLHHDGTGYPDWFIVGATVGDKQISYHLPDSLWGYCSFLETFERSPVAWDGHTSSDVLNILKSLVVETCP